MMRLLAFVRSTPCFEEREQHGEALTHWQRFSVAQATGLPEAELAPLRTCVAYRAGMLEAVLDGPPMVRFCGGLIAARLEGACVFHILLH